MALVQTGGEDITVADSAIGPTSSLVTSEVMMAQFSHRSGGNIHAQTFVDPTAAGNLGDFLFTVGNNWRVWGHDEILSYRMIRVGSVSGTVGVQYFGTGAT